MSHSRRRPSLDGRLISPQRSRLRGLPLDHSTSDRSRERRSTDDAPRTAGRPIARPHRSVRDLAALLALVLTLGASFHLADPGGGAWARTDDRSAPRRPLDLPSGGRGTAAADEDTPETIVLYGGVYEGSGFFWCLDRSGSMQAGGAWEILAAEVADAIDDLSDDAWFGLVAYGSNTLRFSSRARRASPANAQHARAWLTSLEPQGSTCLLPAALEMITIAQVADCSSPVGIIVSDGIPTCDGDDTTDLCLAQIPAAVHDPLVVHTLYISDDAPGVEFLQALALGCGGTFRTVSP